MSTPTPTPTPTPPPAAATGAAVGSPATGTAGTGAATTGSPTAGPTAADLAATVKARSNETYLLWLGVLLPFVLGGLESVIRSAAHNNDRTTFFPPSLAAAGVALFMPLALSDDPYINTPWRRHLLGFVKLVAIVLGFTGLAVWAAILAWSVDPDIVPEWAQMVFKHTQFGSLSSALGAALIYYAVSVLCAFVRNGVRP